MTAPVDDDRAQTATDVLRGIALRAHNAEGPDGVLRLATRVDQIMRHQPEVAERLAASGREHRETTR